MTLCDRDRDLLAVWAVHGVPDDPSTHDKRDRLILALWTENQRLDAALGELLALEADGG